MFKRQRVIKIFTIPIRRKKASGVVFWCLQRLLMANSIIVHLASNRATTTIRRMENKRNAFWLLII